MDNKCISFIVGSLLILPLIGIGLVAGATKVSQVHAQEITNNAPVTHLSHMAQMMNSNDKNQMITMMKTHHGKDWKKECSRMMETMDMDS